VRWSRFGQGRVAYGATHFLPGRRAPAQQHRTARIEGGHGG
jgi:hypothetical protein